MSIHVKSKNSSSKGVESRKISIEDFVYKLRLDTSVREGVFNSFEAAGYDVDDNLPDGDMVRGLVNGLINRLMFDYQFGETIKYFQEYDLCGNDECILNTIFNRLGLNLPKWVIDLNPVSALVCGIGPYSIGSFMLLKIGTIKEGIKDLSSILSSISMDTSGPKRFIIASKEYYYLVVTEEMFLADIPAPEDKSFWLDLHMKAEGVGGVSLVNDLGVSDNGQITLSDYLSLSEKQQSCIDLVIQVTKDDSIADSTALNGISFGLGYSKKADSLVLLPFILTRM